MKEYGTAVSVNGNRVTISMNRTAACEKCGRCSHPHIAFGDNTQLIIEAISLGEIRPGDTVEVEMASRDFLAASLLVWGLPLVAGAVGLGVGIMLGRSLGNPGVWGAVFALGSVGASFFWLHQYDKSAQKTGRYLPVARSLREM
ncbi:MAG: SoxR reducing system RseC family protein [Bacillota bacterium]